MNAGIKIYAPATVANVACGYDILGFAIEKPGDEIIARRVEVPGIRISLITGDKGKLPYETDKNTAGVAATRVLEHLGLQNKVGIELEIHKRMPFGSGLGSSAASAVAGAMAVNELLRHPLEKRELLPFAVAGEQAADGAWHADNVAPCLLGGMTLTRDNDTLDVHRVILPSGLYATVIHPKINILTREAREILKGTVSLDQHIRQSGNLGGLLIGLFQADLELVRRSMQDVIIEPQRAQLIPHFHLVQGAALKSGALGCSISGAGPSIFALCPNSHVARECGSAMQKVFEQNHIDTSLYISPINMQGAYKC